MVTVAQVQAGDPIVAQITALQTIIGQLQAAITAGNWTLTGPLFLHDGNGNAVQVNITSMSAADTVVLCQSALNVCQNDLAALQAQLTVI